MAIADVVSFDVAGLTLHHSEAKECLWANDRGLTVHLLLRESPPAIPIPLTDVAALRTSYAGIVAKSDMGLVELDSGSLNGYAYLRFITRGMADPEFGLRREFIGIIQIPLRSCSVLIKAECLEADPTGAKETAIVSRLLAAGKLDFRPVPPEESARLRGPEDMIGWITDPEDPAPAHLARNASDDPAFDADFPDHALSQVRAFLDRAQNSLSLPASLEADLAASQPAKPWWRIW